MPDVEVKRVLRRVWRLGLVVLAIGLLTVWTTDVLAQLGVQDDMLDEELDGGGLSYPTGDEYQEFKLKSGNSPSISSPWDNSWGGASKDIDIILVKNPDPSETQITGLGGRNRQEGRGATSDTSIAVPHVAGLAALVLQQHPQPTPSQITSYLKNHTHNRGSGRPNNT